MSVEQKYMTVVVLTVCLISNVVSTSYKVTVRTGRGLSAGTDAKFQLTMYDSNLQKLEFQLDGKENKLDRDSEDVFIFKEENLLNIDHITIRRQTARSLFQSWFLRWMKIDLEGAVYHIMVNKWLGDDALHTFRANLESCPKKAKRIQLCQK